MENVDINGLGNEEVVRQLFQSVNCIGNENCFVIVSNRDYLPGGEAPGMNSAATRVGFKAGGIAGGIVGGMVANAINETVRKAEEEMHNSLDEKLEVIFNRGKYCGFLLNKTEKGIGVIPLTNNYKLLVRVEDFKTELESFVFLPFECIEKIEIKNLMFSKKILKVIFNAEKFVITEWTLPLKHKLINYQEANSKKFLENLK